jgi:hypothetical protein
VVAPPGRAGLVPATKAPTAMEAWDGGMMMLVVSNMFCAIYIYIYVYYNDSI